MRRLYEKTISITLGKNVYDILYKKKESCSGEKCLLLRQLCFIGKKKGRF